VLPILYDLDLDKVIMIFKLQEWQIRMKEEYYAYPTVSYLFSLFFIFWQENTDREVEKKNKTVNQADW
jgi:hypothetical protein